ncbi:MAG: hypothetical protein ACYTHK_05480 [Planctomycetota bacterium]
MGLDPPARAIAFAGDRLALLCGDEVRTLGVDVGIPLEGGARAIAFTMGGGLLVGYPGKLVRLGDHPLEVELPGLEVTAIAADPGGYWIGGNALIGFRPTQDDLAERARYEIDSPVRALAYGPDASMYALLEDGRILRDGELRGEVEAIGLTRSGGRLLALTEDAILDVTHVVDSPPEELAEFDLPGCGS